MPCFILSKEQVAIVITPKTNSGVRIIRINDLPVMVNTGVPPTGQLVAAPIIIKAVMWNAAAVVVSGINQEKLLKSTNTHSDEGTCSLWSGPSAFCGVSSGLATPHSG